MYGRAHEVLIYLNRVRDLAFSRARDVMNSAGLSPGEFDILATLRRSPPPNVLSPTELQRSVLITSGGLTKLLYQLEARDLVSRSVQADDKRCKLVHLTEKGRQTVEAALAEVMELEKQWLEDALTGADIEQLITLLSQAARALEGAGTDQPVSAAQR